MKEISSFQHFVGCDVSKNTLDFAIYAGGQDYRMFDHIQVSNSLEGFQTMRKWLSSFRIKIKEAVIGMEHTGYYSQAFAQWCDKKSVTFVLLHPLDVKHAGARGRNKTDKIDAQFIADYIYTMREKLEPSSPEAPIINRLRELRNERQLAVRTRASYINQMKTVNDKMALSRMQKTADTLTSQIHSIETEIKNVIASDSSMKKNCELLLSIPGIGLINAVTTLVATGNFTRFQTARQYAKFSCVSPLSNQSGTSVRKSEHVSHAGHSEIKSILTEAARSAITHDTQLKNYYQRKRDEGKTHGCVMNAVKFKLICRMFAVIKRQEPFVNIEAYRS